MKYILIVVICAVIYVPVRALLRKLFEDRSKEE